MSSSSAAKIEEPFVALNFVARRPGDAAPRNHVFELSVSELQDFSAQVEEMFQAMQQP